MMAKNFARPNTRLSRRLAKLWKRDQEKILTQTAINFWSAHFAKFSIQEQSGKILHLGEGPDFKAPFLDLVESVEYDSLYSAYQTFLIERNGGEVTYDTVIFNANIPQETSLPSDTLYSRPQNLKRHIETVDFEPEFDDLESFLRVNSSVDTPLIASEPIIPELDTPEPQNPSLTSESWTIYGPSVNLENRPDIDEIASLCWSFDSSEDSIFITPPPSPSFFRTTEAEVTWPILNNSGPIDVEETRFQRTSSWAELAARASQRKPFVNLIPVKLAAVTSRIIKSRYLAGLKKGWSTWI